LDYADKYHKYQNILNNRMSDINYKKRDMKDMNTLRLLGLGVGSFFTGATSAIILDELNSLSPQDRHNVQNSPKYKAMSSYFSKLYDKAQTEEAKEAINNE
jgi:hypothetical protein